MSNMFKNETRTWCPLPPYVMMRRELHCENAKQNLCELTHPGVNFGIS